MSGVPKICARRLVGNVASSVILQPKEKVIHFVRHAQGFHNVAGEEDYSNYQSEDHFDAKLTPLGEQQCQHLSSRSSTLAPDLVVVSPMTRTLQTASISFPNLVDNCPWLAIEHIREASGFHPCDRRQTLSVYRDMFSHVDFSAVVDEDDPLYYLHDGREPDAHVVGRSHKFFTWLAGREEKEIVVVTYLHLIPI